MRETISLKPSSHLRTQLAASQRLAEDGANLGDDLIDRDRGQAFFAFDDAGLEAAAPAIGLVVEDAMLLAVGKPDAWLVAGGEDGDAGRLDGCGEVHRAAVVADEDAGLGEDGGALAGREQAAEIDDGAAGVLPPAIGGELAGLAFFGGSAEGQGVVRDRGRPVDSGERASCRGPSPSIGPWCQR